jgi:riboflavin synthase
MFTGIVQSTGQIVGWKRRGNDARMRIEAAELNSSQIEVGDSIAVSGVCLTVTSIEHDSLHTDISAETLKRSTLGGLTTGSEVNLELALTATSRMGGHIVSGHVDGVGEVIARETVGESTRIMVAAPQGLARYIAEKGSICVDGVSLTVNYVSGARFQVNIIPHTLKVTTIKRYAAGTPVNLEVDLIARYLERLLLGSQAAQADEMGTSPRTCVRHAWPEDDQSANAGG